MRRGAATGRCRCETHTLFAAGATRLCRLRLGVSATHIPGDPLDVAPLPLAKAKGVSLAAARPDASRRDCLRRGHDQLAPARRRHPLPLHPHQKLLSIRRVCAGAQGLSSTARCTLAMGHSIRTPADGSPSRWQPQPMAAPADGSPSRWQPLRIALMRSGLLVLAGSDAQ